ncbi:hypothetical protein [Luteibacter aegosomatissinici]|uniref:hypothetical protein n=1 Tax=Luteibacter aegosomatissinici TaxID=2911539 RepID=UPI001FFAFC9B|nr:hypothetical protein [Luteibacter aegosomatissinici]UPG92804.1 hypothetical protein L2Y97_13110 [Luteibacter aegosomatissinici]
MLFVWGVGLMLAAPSRKHSLAMGAFLLMGWLEAFVPRPPFFQPLAKTVDGYRTGLYPRPRVLDLLVALTVFGMMIAAMLTDE